MSLRRPTISLGLLNDAMSLKPTISEKNTVASSNTSGYTASPTLSFFAQDLLRSKKEILNINSSRLITNLCYLHFLFGELVHCFSSFASKCLYVSNIVIAFAFNNTDKRLLRIQKEASNTLASKHKVKHGHQIPDIDKSPGLRKSTRVANNKFPYRLSQDKYPVRQQIQRTKQDLH